MARGSGGKEKTTETEQKMRVMANLMIDKFLQDRASGRLKFTLKSSKIKVDPL